MNLRLPQAVQDTITTMTRAGFECYAVGGSVRDLLLGRPTKTWDFTTSATPEEIIKVFPDSFYDNKFGTVGIKIKNIGGEIEDIFEITPYRKEGKYSDQRHPDSVTWAKTLVEDLSRRDFTINSIALGLHVRDHLSNKASGQAVQVQIIDTFKGQEDLIIKVVRSVGEPNDRFQEDPLRLIRAIRIATQLGFTIESQTWRAIQKNANLISQISHERVRDEIVKILSSDFPADGIKLLQTSGLLEFILPELVKGIGVSQKGTHHTDDVFDHSLAALKHCQNSNWIVRLAVLLHDVGKPVTYKEQNGKATFYNHDAVGAHIAKEIANRLRLRKEDRDKLFTLVRYHMFSVSEFLTDSAVRRFIRRVGSDNMTDILDLRTADRLGSGVKSTSWRHEEFKQRLIDVQKHIPSVNDLKVDGHDVMKILKIKPGPKIGEILNKLFEEITENPDKNDREYLIKKIKDLGA